MSGRLPIHVNQMNSAEWPWTAAAMHPNFTTVADVLRAKAGYTTHAFGKCNPPPPPAARRLVPKQPRCVPTGCFP